jgi:hypothetical protein|tara:strand:+ start:66 stop:242 length:177 start_codon:yes stop_codon:yes gene_type:complete
MIDFISWIISIIEIVPWIISGASTIAALTPTPKDDLLIGKLYKIVDFCSINIGKAKEK